MIQPKWHPVRIVAGNGGDTKEEFCCRSCTSPCYVIRGLGKKPVGFCADEQKNSRTEKMREEITLTVPL